uniref:Hypothetical conserved protein n=1 Tax=Acetithermum autotrophicum TaxID=1446466 RepID=H5SV57_ACEAU|nr:hypothetical conserved protein [Candidatus Acetothermum autotrophicum]
MMEFPYVNRRGQYYPVVPVTLHHGDREIRTEALIDSGASISTFQGDLAEPLGLVLEQGEKIYLQGIGGRVLGYVHEVQLQIGTEQIRCKIVFSSELISSVNLLGRVGFFEHFFVSFDERNHKVIIKPYRAMLDSKKPRRGRRVAK